MDISILKNTHLSISLSACLSIMVVVMLDILLDFSDCFKQNGVGFFFFRKQYAQIL